jgi:hypothetical protein
VIVHIRLCLFHTFGGWLLSGGFGATKGSLHCEYVRHLEFTPEGNACSLFFIALHLETRVVVGEKLRPCNFRQQKREYAADLWCSRLSIPIHEDVFAFTVAMKVAE